MKTDNIPDFTISHTPGLETEYLNILLQYCNDGGGTEAAAAAAIIITIIIFVVVGTN
jgi:hypothetical protein